MRRVLSTAFLLALGTALGGCDTWSGKDTPRDTPAFDTDTNPASKDAGPTKSPDAGAPVEPPDAAGLLDAQVADAGSDGGTETLGDPRPGQLGCGEVSCDSGEVCCTAAGDAAQAACNPSCGPTEGQYACDGPEDCDAGQVCCHEFSARSVGSVCLSLQPAQGADAGPAPECVSAPDGPERRVACHEDADCDGFAATPFCRKADPGRPVLGYCVANTDDTTTPGHDDRAVVGCGEPEADAGASLCALDRNACCLSTESGEAQCGSACGFSETRVRCDGPEDCGAGVCCHVPEQTDADGGVHAEAVLCAERCDGLGEGARQRCHRDTDCADGNVCAPDEQAPWWGSCRAP